MSVFLNLPQARIIFRGTNFFLIEDSYPISPGHILIISNKEKKDFFDLDEAERKELPEMVHIAKRLIEAGHTPDGYNIGMNCGVAAGQTVMHFHCHVIPRYHGDMEDPKGGVRHCISGKGYY